MHSLIQILNKRISKPFSKNWHKPVNGYYPLIKPYIIKP